MSNEKVSNDHDLKQCYHCKRRLTDSHFRFNQHNKTIKVGICKNCQGPKSKSQRKYGHSKKGLTTARKAKLKHYFNLTPKEYDLLYERQNGVCVICDKNERLNLRLAIDHDHKTGKVRGLLCRKCNSGIGFFKDDLELLINAMSYLKEFKNDPGRT